MSRIAFVLMMLAACSKDAGPSKSDKVEPRAGATRPVAAAPVQSTVGSDGLRHISVEADDKGYHPNRISGKPGEKLVMTVTRTSDADCLSQIKTPDGATVDLPKGKATDVAITVPKSGEAAFTCGMGMFKGTVVADTGG